MIIKQPDTAEIPGLRQLWQEAFGDSQAFLDSFFTTAFSPDRSLGLWQDGQVLAACYWFDCSCRGQACAYVYAVATAKRHRGRGYAHLLMEQLHSLLKDRGYAMAVLVPGSPELFRFYSGMGYRAFSPMEELVCAAGDQPAALRAVNREEYARLRREYLSSGGVVQEGENLAFLETQAMLYAGQDFLLAARVENGALFAPELLGNEQAAPEILKALDCSAGTFRIPGGERDFAMYYPLKQATPPEYFALAFD